MMKTFPSVFIKSLHLSLFFFCFVLSINVRAVNDSARVIPRVFDSILIDFETEGKKDITFYEGLISGSNDWGKLFEALMLYNAQDTRKLSWKLNELDSLTSSSDSTFLIRLYLLNGVKNMMERNFDQSKKDLTKALLISNQLQDEAASVLTTYFIVKRYFQVSQFDLSFRLSNEVLNNSTAQISDKMLVLLLDAKGQSLILLNRGKEAIESFRKAKELTDNLESKYCQIRMSMFLAKSYQYADSTDLAIKYYNEAISKAKRLIDQQILGETFLAFGKFWFEMNNMVLAEQYMRKAQRYLEKKTRYKDIQREALSELYLSLGKVFYEKKDIKKAKRFIEKSITNQSSDSPSVNLREAYTLMSKLHYLLNNFESAYHYIKLSSIVSDSLEKAGAALKINELKSEYEDEYSRKEAKQEQTNSVEISQIKRQYKLYIFLIGILMVLSCITTVYFYTIANRRRLNVEYEHDQNQKIKAETYEVKEKYDRLNEALQLKTLQTEVINRHFFEPISDIETILREDSRQDDLFIRIMISIKTLKYALQNMLVLNSIERDKVQYEMRRFSLNKLLERVSKSFKQKKEKDVEFVFEKETNLPDWVHSDEQKIEVVLINLLNNAFKFTHKGRVVLSVVVVNKEQTFNGMLLEVKFTVMDTGIGIPPEQIDLAKEPFYAIENDTDAEIGLGLGLTISNNYVSLLGSKLNVTSEKGQGSSFSFNLKLKADQLMVQSNSALKRKEQIARFNDNLSILYPYEILVVEDNFVNLTYIMTLLRKFGYKPDQAGDGQECLDKVEKKQFDLILMDIQMPVMDGITANNEIKKRLSLKDQPIVIAVSANIAGSDKKEYLDLGFDDFISKPFSADELQNVLVNWYEKVKK